MKHVFVRFTFVILFVAGCSHSAKVKPATETYSPAFVYPQARIDNVVDDYHGTKVADPYRWLEDTDSPETRAWIEAENKITFSYLEKIPRREKIHQRLKELWNYEKYGIPTQENGRYLYKINNGLQNQSVLFTATSLNEEPKVLIDPNALSPDGTIALQDYVMSHDAKLLAYGLSTSGSDWLEWKVRDIETEKRSIR